MKDRFEETSPMYKHKSNNSFEFIAVNEATLILCKQCLLNHYTGSMLAMYCQLFMLKNIEHKWAKISISLTIVSAFIRVVEWVVASTYK